MFLNCLKKSFINFIMNFENLIYLLSDFFELCLKIYKLHILPYFFALWYYNVPLAIISAETISNRTNERLDNSLVMSRGYMPKYPDDDSFCKIAYTFQNVQYIMAYHKKNQLPFPPYYLNTFVQKVKPGIASITLCCEDKEYDFTEILKKYAGPKQNFYSDKEDYSGLNWEWTELHKQMHISSDAEVRVMNTHGILRSSKYFSDT